MGVNTLIQVGNSDDRLSQAEWSRFVMEMRDLMHRSEVQIHGEWFSGPDQPWQNANWCVEVLPPAWWLAAQENPETAAASNASGSALHMRDGDMRQTRHRLKDAVRTLCRLWRQDTFAWTTGEVELVETGWQEPPWGDREREQAIQAMRIKLVERVARAIQDPSTLVSRERPKRIQDLAMRQVRPLLDQAEMDAAGLFQQQVKEHFNRMGIEEDSEGNTTVRRGGVPFPAPILPSTPGEDKASALPAPASTGAVDRQRAVHEESHLQVSGLLFNDCDADDCVRARRCTHANCLVSHDIRTHHVMDSPGNRGRAVVERWGDLKPAWRELLLRVVDPQGETPGEAVQEKPSKVDGHAE